jgi:hypothetical protein
LASSLSPDSDQNKPAGPFVDDVRHHQKKGSNSWKGFDKVLWQLLVEYLRNV